MRWKISSAFTARTRPDFCHKEEQEIPEEIRLDAVGAKMSIPGALSDSSAKENANR